jgi:hypothetical protein
MNVSLVARVTAMSRDALSWYTVRFSRGRESVSAHLASYASLSIRRTPIRPD